MESRSPESDKILFWEDVIASSEILEQYKTVIDKLRSGDYRAADLDLKVRTHPRVYSIKINDKERLLFTTIKIKTNDGVKKYAYIIDELLNHKYENSFAMHGGADSIIHSHEADEIIAAYIANQLDKNLNIETINNHNGKSSYRIEYLAADYLDEKWIELNDKQKMVLKEARPFICNGTPGSGKSTLSLAVIAKAIDDGFTYIIYITQSVPLKNEMQENWNNSPYSKDLPQNVVVKFATYTELLLEEHQNKTIVGDKHCLDWISDKFISRKNRNKSKEKLPEFPEDFFCSQSIYDEFRTISAYTKKEYIELGERQCLLADYNDAKKTIWDVFLLYKSHLKTIDCIHPAFTQLSEDKKYPMIILDEGQDFSTLQLSSLCNQAENSNISIFHDSDQSIIDKISKEDFLKSWFFNRLKLSIKPIELSYSYRSAIAIVNAGNHVLDLRVKLYEGRVNSDQKIKIESNPEDKRIGSVAWPLYYDPKSKDLKKSEIGRKLIEQLRERAKSAQCAIITLEHLVEEAMQVFDTGAVFTVADIKGLQRREIIIYRLFDDPKNKPFFTEINTRLLQVHGNKINNNRSKLRSAKSNPFLMNLYVAILRATDYVEIVQEEFSYLKNIKKFLLEGMCDKLDEKKPIENTSEADWEDLTKKLEKNNNQTQINNIKRKRKKLILNEQPGEKIHIRVVPKKEGATKNRYPMKYDVNEIKEDVYAYLNKLMREFSLGNIENLLSSKQAIKYLLGIPFKLESKTKKACLYTHIADNENYMKIFLDALWRKLYTDKLYSLLPKELDTLLLDISNKNIPAEENIKMTVDTVLYLKHGWIEQIIKYDHALLLITLMDRGYIDVKKTYTDGFNLLQIAAFAGREAIVQYITKEKLIGTEETGIAKAWETPLFLAAYQGRIDVVKILIMEGANVNGNDEKYIRTPLMAAIQNKHSDIKNLLVISCAKFPVVDGVSYSLAKFASFNDVSNIMEELENGMKNKISVNPHCIFNRNYPIEFDVNDIESYELDYLNNLLSGDRFSEGSIKSLLSKRSAIRWLHGIRFRAIAINYGNNKIEQLTLLQHIRHNKEYATILLNALCSTDNNENKEFILLLLPVKLDTIVMTVTDRESNLNTCMSLSANTVLTGECGLISLAVEHDHVQFIWLISCTLMQDFSQLYFSNLNMLQLAAFCGSKGVANLLIKTNMINMEETGQARPYETPLYIAAYEGHAEVVSLLIEFGADVNGNDEFGIRTPIMAALDGKHLDVVTILKKAGAQLHEYATTWAGEDCLVVLNDSDTNFMEFLEDKNKVKEIHKPKKDNMTSFNPGFFSNSVNVSENKEIALLVEQNEKQRGANVGFVPV